MFPAKVMAKLFDKSLITIQDKNGKLNLFALMMPIFLQAIINNMLGTINTAALSNYDSTIITAMNVSNRIIAPETTFALLAAAGLSIVLAQALGRNDKELIDNFANVIAGKDISHSDLRSGILSAKMCLMAKKSAETSQFCDI